VLLAYSGWMCLKKNAAGSSEAVVSATYLSQKTRILDP